jgi:hypothetical protein
MQWHGCLGVVLTLRSSPLLSSADGQVAAEGAATCCCCVKCTHLCDSLMDSLCAKALHSDVFPVPGGPCSRTTLQHTIKTTHTRAVL